MDGTVVYRSRPSRRTASRPPEARWDVLEFVARIIDHVPEPSLQTVRYWGYYANSKMIVRRFLWDRTEFVTPARQSMMARQRS